MPDQDWFSQQAPKAGAGDWFASNAKPAQKIESVAHAQVRGFKEGASKGAADLYEGTKEGLTGTLNMLRHPIDTARAMGSGIASAAEAVPDVARNLLNSDARGATAKGFVRGASEGAAGVNSDASFSKQIGQFIGGTVIPTVATAGTVRGVRMLRAGAAPALVVETAGGQQIGRFKGGKPIKVLEPPTTGAPETSRTPYVAPVEAATASKPSPNAGGRLVAGGEPASKPATTNVVQALSEGLQQAAEPAFQQQAARRAPRMVRVGDSPVAPTAAEPKLPASWQALVDLDKSTAAPAAAPATTATNFPVKRTPKPGAVQTARNALGAREAGHIFGMTEGEVRAAAPGPSRQPYKKLMAELDGDYQRRIADERGFIDPALMRTLGVAMGGGVAGSLAADDHPLAGALIGALGGAAVANPSKALKALQEARMTGMLSGAALPKSIAGNVGAVATAAVENGSLAPIREALRLPTNARNAVKGFINGAQPDSGPIGKMNPFGRAMSAMDETTRAALERAGISSDEIHRLLLTKPSPLGGGTLAKAVQTPLGKAVMPFQKIPINTVAEGINSLNELMPGSGASNVKRALTVGAGAAGAAAGSKTDHKLLLGLLAALAGPRAIPFALGAGLTAGPAVIERVAGGLPDASFKDLINPLRPIDKPALMRLLETGGR